MKWVRSKILSYKEVILMSWGVAKCKIIENRVSWVYSNIF